MGDAHDGECDGWSNGPVLGHADARRRERLRAAVLAADSATELGFTAYAPPILDPERPEPRVTVLSVLPIPVKDGGMMVRLTTVQ